MVVLISERASLNSRIFVPPENNAILEFLLGRTVTGESPSKANARRESLRPRAGSSPVREDGKGKERGVDSEDEDGADAAATAPSKQTRRKSARLRSESVQPIAGEYDPVISSNDGRAHLDQLLFASRVFPRCG